ncbi:MAG: hypothetical protein HN590_14600 [Calditrichaeota bacterium]|nr:hypothetical protein [Calditrichota bacterium]
MTSARAHIVNQTEKHQMNLQKVCLFTTIYFLIGSLCSFLAAQVVEDPYQTWLSLPPSQQLYVEGADDQKGMGRIFVPAITSPANEPFYAVFQGEELIGERRMGSSFFLPPGKYSIIFGTGSIQQRIQREIDIDRGQTIIFDPDWCALSVDVIDESRNNFKKDLQVYDNETLENFGILSAINPELGEQLQSLLLEPGLYKIVPRGSDPNTFVNFATVHLETGTYTPYTLVINSQTGDFIGSGILPFATRTKQNSLWKHFPAVHGSIIINDANNVTEEESKINISVLTQFENRLLYDQLPHFLLSNNLIEIGALRQEKQTFLITQDRVQLKNTYVYYFLPFLGGYTRFEVSTHLFPTISRFETGRDITLRDLDLIEEVLTNVDDVELEPSLFPLGLKEGIGVNITALRTFTSRLNIRAGFGYRQTYNKSVYKQSSFDVNLYQRIPNNFVRGFETSLISNLSILNNLTITTELDVLFPTGSMDLPVVDLENTSTLGLTRNVTLEHIFRLNRDPALDWTVREQFLSVRISYFFF